MTSNIWTNNIELNLRLVDQNLGPSVFVAVTGNEKDRNYWQDHFESVRGELFRRDESTLILSVAETTKKGNFLGTLNAWIETRKNQDVSARNLPDITLLNMLFGQGKRFSPFTQALGNRKSAFLLPFNSQKSGLFFSTADLSCLYTNLWIDQLRQQGFRGVVAKWGDEAVIPGRIMDSSKQGFAKSDGVRFIWKTSLTEELARDKEWILVESSTKLVKKQFARSNYQNLYEKLSSLPEHLYEVGVNLGSLAISYDFLDIAINVFEEDIADKSKWIDWDPYVWIALHTESLDKWYEVVEEEKMLGLSGLQDLVQRYPDLYEKISEVRRRLEEKNDRSFSIHSFDFGKPYWADFGLHHSLRSQLESLLAKSDDGVVSRKLFQIPEETDENGNRIIRSSIPDNAKITNSIIMDSVITDSNTEIDNGLVVGGLHGSILMPYGGSALFCSVDHLEFSGPHGVAFGSVGKSVALEQGGRHTTLFTYPKFKHLVGSEKVIDLKGENYENKILGNDLSFAEAETLMSEVDPQGIEKLRQQIRTHGWKHLEELSNET
jgi:hypothetical protein